MLQNELSVGLVGFDTRVSETERRARDAAPAEKAGRVSVAARTREDAVRFLVKSCADLQGWPSPDLVGDDAAAAAMAIFRVAQEPQMRSLLPLMEDSARKGSLARVYVAEATDALCVAGRRPQVYGTVPDHPVADAARLDRLRAGAGLPALGSTGVKHASVPRPAPAPSLQQLPEGFEVLRGLITDLPAVPTLPRVVRPTVASSEPWGCAYCCGKAVPGSAELDIRGRVWRICSLCEAVDDTPQGRLLDVLMTVGNISMAKAKATAETARERGWRVPLRYEDSRARPNHRPQPRWAYMEPTAVAKLVALAEQHIDDWTQPNAEAAQAQDTGARLAQQTQPSSVRPAASTAPPAAAAPGPVAEEQLGRSPLAMSKRALEMLSWPASTPLTRLQVSQALQVGEGNLERNALLVQNVGQLQEVFAHPPLWLREFHAQRARERAANYARQTGTAFRPPGASLTHTAAAAASPRPVPTPRSDLPPVVAHDVSWTPHPDMLISTQAAEWLRSPAPTPMRPGQAARALQVACTHLDRNGLSVRTVAELAAVLAAPPSWLLAFHRKLAAERQAAAPV